MLDFDGIPLGSTYKRYKLGTAKLTNWLRETASMVVRKSGQALRIADVLSTNDLLRLAELISNSKKPKVTVPISILLCTNAVIKGRRMCADLYKQLEEEGTKTGKSFTRMNKSHQYFVSVIEKVESHLKELEVDSAAKASARPSKLSASAGKKKCTFDMLELDEPSISTQSSQPSDSVPASNPPDPFLSDSLEEEAEMEESFAIFCAFQDMHYIRTHLQAVWKKYYDGDISFLVSIELTETGFQIIRDTSDGLRRACPWIVSYDSISSYIGLGCSEVDGMSAYFTHKLAKIIPTTGLGSPGRNTKPEELFCGPAYAILNDFRVYCRSMREPNNKSFRVRRSPLSLAVMLRKMEPTIRFLADQTGSRTFNIRRVQGFWLDSLTGGLVATSKFGTFPVWLVAKFQIFMDILDALGKDPKIGYDVLQDTILRASLSIRLENQIKLINEMASFAHVPEDTARRARAFNRTLNAETERIKSMKEGNGGHGRPEGRPESMTGTFTWPADRHPELLLPSCPMLSGYRLRALIFGNHLYNIRKANEDISILGAAFAYSAARAFGVAGVPWPDMETVIGSQSMHRSYVPEASNVAGHARNFDAAIGMAPTNSRSNDRGRRPKVPHATTIASQMRKLMPASSYVLSVQEAEITTEAGDRGIFYESLYLTARRVYNTDRQANLTPLELLNALQKSLLNDEVYVKFDYDEFSGKCRALLLSGYRSTPDAEEYLERARLKMESGSNDFEELLEHDAKAAEFVHSALWEAADLEKRGASWETKSRSKLGKLAFQMVGMTGCDPESWLSVARHGSSGHIASSDAPRSRWKWGGEPLTFGPETPWDYQRRKNKTEVDKILNAACAQYREWASLGISNEARVAKVKPWVTQKLFEAGISWLKVVEVTLISDYGQIHIEVASRRDGVID